MFKKFKKTKMMLGGIAVGAMAAFPIAASVNTAVTAPATTVAYDDSSGTSLSKTDPWNTETFASNEGKIISTHDWVIDTSKINSANFNDHTATKALFDDKKGPLNKLYKDPDTGVGLGDTYAKMYQPVQDATGLNHWYGKTNTAGTVGSFFTTSGLTKLFNTLNKDLATKVVMGQRYNFSVPKNVIDIAAVNTGSTGAASDLPSKPVTVSASQRYSYKVASIAAGDISDDKTVALDYMFQPSAGADVQKVQIVFKGTAALKESTKSIQDLINEGSIFIRSMDDTKKSDDAAITGGFNINNAGLTISREGDSINVYTSLSNSDAKSAVMLDKNTDAGEDAHVEVGDLGDKYKDPTFAVPATGAMALDSFKVFALTNKWEDESGYTWKDGSNSVDTFKISFYMKAGTQIKADIFYKPVKLDTDSVTIKATDTTVEMDPSTPLQIESGDFEDGAESMEVEPQEIKSIDTSYGTWYKVTLHVAKSTSQKHFLVGSNSDTDELPWTIDDATSRSDVFFKQPWATDYSPETAKDKLGIPFQKHINQSSVETDVLKEVYGSWVKPNSWVTNTNVVNLLDIDRNTATDDSNPWRVNGAPFAYNTLNTVNGVADVQNPKSKSMGAWNKMSDVITALNEYHNDLMDAEHDHLGLATASLRNIYEPTSATDFASNVSANLQKTPDVWKKIQDEIKDVLPILSLSVSEYQHMIASFQTTPDAYTGSIDFAALEKKYGKLAIEAIVPEDKNAADSELTGTTTIAKFVAEDVEKLIPTLFDLEWSQFEAKMKEPQAVKFNNFLGYSYTKAVNVIDKDAISKGEIVVDTSGKAKVFTEEEFSKYTLKDGESVIDYSDLASGAVTTTPAQTGRSLIEALYTVLYRTGMYKGFISDPALQQTFVELMTHDTSLPGEKYPLWGATAYEVNGQNIVAPKLQILEDIVEGLENNNGGVTSTVAPTTPTSADDQSDDPGVTIEDFSTFLATPSVKTEDIAKRMEALVEELSNGDETSQTYVWTQGNQATSSLLARMILTNNVSAVSDYLEAATKANKDPLLAKRYEAFRASIATSRGLAQLGPKLKMYDIQEFVDGLSKDTAKTPEIMEKMLRVDPVRVLIPDTPASQTTEILRDSGGTIVFGLIVASGVIMALIGGILLFLSFTKRMVVNGKTWSVKLIVIRIAIVAILVVGVYILAAGTILPGHAALTSVLKV